MDRPWGWAATALDPLAPERMSIVRVTHVPTGEVLAEGPKGWGITPFEGNYYIRRKHLKTDGFRVNYVPGLCFYKFLYVWMDLRLEGHPPVKSAGWMYFLPNPLFPFIWFRVGVSGSHPEMLVEELEQPDRAHVA